MTKWLKYSKLSLILLVFLFGRFSCGDEKSDPCDDTRWEKKLNFSVQPKLNASNADLPDDKVLKEANKLLFVGLVRKYHCGGVISEDYHMESEHDPGAIGNEHWTNGFYVGKVYGFDFENDEDYLECQYILAAVFDDGRIYESDPQLLQVRPPFIMDWTRHYFILQADASVSWHLKAE